MIPKDKTGQSGRLAGLIMLLVGIIIIIGVFASWSTTNSLLTSKTTAFFFIIGILSVLIGWIFIKGR